MSELLDRNQTAKESETEIPVEPFNQRKEPRYPSAGEAEITPLDAGPAEPIQGEVIDVSKSGLRVRSPKSFNDGARLRVRFGEMLAFAVVRWCHSRGGGYDAGMRIEHMVPYSLVTRVRRAAAGGEK